MEVYEISIFSPENYLNDTAQFSEDMREIYIWKNLLKYGHPNYVETFMDWIRMTQIFMDFSAIGNNTKKCTVMWVIM